MLTGALQHSLDGSRGSPAAEVLDHELCVRARKVASGGSHCGLLDLGHWFLPTHERVSSHPDRRYRHKCSQSLSDPAGELSIERAGEGQSGVVVSLQMTTRRRFLQGAAATGALSVLR